MIHTTSCFKAVSETMKCPKPMVIRVSWNVRLCMLHRGSQSSESQTSSSWVWVLVSLTLSVRFCDTGCLSLPFPVEVRNGTQNAGRQAGRQVTCSQRWRKVQIQVLPASPPRTLNKLCKIFPHFPFCEMIKSQTYTRTQWESQTISVDVCAHV